jgi:hypothetical protein
MTNTDAIEIRGPGSIDDLIAVVGPVVDQTQRGRPIVRLTDDVFATALFDEDDEYPYLLDVGSRASEERQRDVANVLFDLLSSDTPWALRQSSDDDDEIRGARSSP